MTWKKLGTLIAAMDEKQANSDVAIHLKGDDGNMPDGMDFIPENEVLDKNHPFLIINY